MEKSLNTINSESLRIGIRIQKGKTKYMTNYADSDLILIDQEEIEKVTNFKYLRQITLLKETTITKEEINASFSAAWSCFGKKTRVYKDKQLSISLKNHVMDQCVLPTMTYGCQTWSLNKQLTKKELLKEQWRIV